MIDYLPWVLSLTTVLAMYVAGGTWRYAWSVPLANQTLWLVWIILAAQWGFLPGNIALWVVYLRNHWVRYA